MNNQIARDHQPLGASTLFEPLRYTLANFIMSDKFTTICLAYTPLDLVKQVEPIQGILDASLLRQVLTSLQYLLLGPHADSVLTPYPKHCLSGHSHSGQSR